MRFVHWYPLSEVADCAPCGPGVFQIRIDSGLIDYPSGKSAMIHYASSTDLRAAVSEFAASHLGRPWLCRHSVELSPREEADPDAMLAELLGRFKRRFGSPPQLPS